MAAMGLLNLGSQGMRPVSISMTVHPSDQTSAFFHPCADWQTVPLMTSGAMKKGVPCAAGSGVWEDQGRGVRAWEAEAVEFERNLQGLAHAYLEAAHHRLVAEALGRPEVRQLQLACGTA